MTIFYSLINYQQYLLNFNRRVGSKFRSMFFFSVQFVRKTLVELLLRLFSLSRTELYGFSVFHREDYLVPGHGFTVCFLSGLLFNFQPKTSFFWPEFHTTELVGGRRVEYLLRRSVVEKRFVQNRNARCDAHTSGEMQLHSKNIGCTSN